MAAILRLRDRDGNIIETPYIKGEDGKTPIKGEDYWTPEDKNEIKEYIESLILGGEW